MAPDIRQRAASLFDWLFGGKGRVMFWVIVADLLGFSVGAWIGFGGDANTPVNPPAIASALLVPTMVTFIGLLWIRGMREAIAAGFFILFVLLLVTSIVAKVDTAAKLSTDLAATFQQLMTTVVAFYFASAAVVEATKVVKESKHSEAVRDDPPKAPPGGG